MTITRVSVDSAGNQRNAGGRFPSISADGRFVVFSSLPANTGFNLQANIFVRDLLTNTTIPVSVDSAGNLANSRNGRPPSISADGRFVSFKSDASNLVPGNTNTGPGRDIFVRDLLTNTTNRVSVSADRGNGVESRNSSISANGRFVAFDSITTIGGDVRNPILQGDIFVRDLLSNTITPVSVDLAGNLAKGVFSYSSISADGRFVLFGDSGTVPSDASKLVAGDTNANLGGMFVRDLSTNTTTGVSLFDSVDQSSGFFPSMSNDGRFVAFNTSNTDRANDVEVRDLPTNTTMRLPVNQISVRDLSTNTTTRVSVDSAGDRGNNSSGPPSISADGRFVAFKSFASNLVPEDTNNQPDIFVRDLLTKTTTRISGDLADRNPGFYSPDGPSISADGKFVAFESSVSNLVPGDTNNATDVFVADTGSTPNVINNPPSVINGTSSDDNLTGTSGNDTINGLEDDDVLRGLRGNDILNGDDDNDVLVGGKGFDTLNGGLGDDNLLGGAGNDVFILGAGFGVDTISDFGNGQDTIQLINGLTFGQLSIFTGTNGTLIGIAKSDEVLAVLTGVAPNLIGSKNFIFG